MWREGRNAMTDHSLAAGWAVSLRMTSAPLKSACMVRMLSVGCPRLVQGLVAVQGDERIEAGVEPVYPIEKLGRQFDGGDFPGRQRGGQFAGALAHAQFEFILRLLQRLCGSPAPGDVHKSHDRAAHLCSVQDRVAGILHGKGRSITAPEHLGVDAARARFAKGVEDRAFVHRIVPSVRLRVMGQFMHVAPQHISRIPTQHACAGAIDEGAIAVHVDAKDPFAGGFQQKAQGVRPQSGACRAGAIRRELGVVGHAPALKQWVCQHTGKRPEPARRVCATPVHS